ncbi:MAG: hypothetical protein KatS3mg119_2391 [Rhodothalassiaceae bacterium]|nr:MAG: hypothetical protein KatS3mg119_2391 [Rhodothalassiaceae bacterium]
MELVLLIIHIFLALALVGVILLQQSEGGALGIGGGGGLFTARGAANFLTRTTAILATLFLATSLALAILAKNRSEGRSVLDQAPVETPAAGQEAPRPQPDQPREEEPEVPVPQ